MQQNKSFAANQIPNLDLISEASQILRGSTNQEIDGISENIEQIDDIKITTIEVFSEDAAQKIGKKKGIYITIDIPTINSEDFIDSIAGVVGHSLKQLLPPFDVQSPILLVGLGNDQATPDALGPKVIEHSFATRHLFKLNDSQALDGLRPVAALAPGVLGITGIETAEIIKAVAKSIKPAAIIAIDSLAAGSISRLGNTIQITDSGINPGSGLGNKRMSIDKESLKIPLIAIGVPMVVNCQFIIYEALNLYYQEQAKNWGQAQSQGQGYLQNQPSADFICRQVLANFEGNLIVTPKDIDQLIDDSAQILAAAIAQAIHPAVNEQNYRHYLRI